MFLVYAKTPANPERPSARQPMSLFLVDKHTPGFSV
jgi:hypothetical protein